MLKAWVHEYVLLRLYEWENMCMYVELVVVEEKEWLKS